MKSARSATGVRRNATMPKIKPAIAVSSAIQRATTPGKTSSATAPANVRYIVQAIIGDWLSDSAGLFPERETQFDGAACRVGPSIAGSLQELLQFPRHVFQHADQVARIFAPIRDLHPASDAALRMLALSRCSVSSRGRD